MSSKHTLDESKQSQPNGPVRNISGTTFAVGDVLTLIGSAVDGNGNAMDASSSLTWELRQQHNTHFHPFLDPTNGNHINLPAAPSPEDILAAKNAYLEVLLTATDSIGLAATTSVIVYPQIVTFAFTSNPSGVALKLDGFTFTAPKSVSSWGNHPLSVQADNQNDLVFHQSWSDGGAASHVDTVMTVNRAASEATSTTTYGRRTCKTLRTVCTQGSECCSGNCSSAKRCKN